MINSVIWRAHHSTKPIFAKFRISKQAEKTIRLTLDTLLPPYENYKVKGKHSKWVKELESVEDIITLYPYVILTTILEDQDRTENIIYFSDVEKNPFHIIVNEFIILPFMIGKKINFGKQDFFELNDKYDLESLLNRNFDEIRIGNLELEHWKEVRDKLYNLVKEKYQLLSIALGCLNLAYYQGIYPSKLYMKHCIKCRQNQ